METRNQKARMAIELDSYLSGLDRANRNRRAALDNYNSVLEDYKAAFTPLGGFATEGAIRSILSECPDGTAYPRSHILVCVALLMYSPVSLFGGKIPLELAKKVASVLSVKHSSVYIARNKVSSWLRLYPDFFKIVFSIFNKTVSNL